MTTEGSGKIAVFPQILVIESGVKRVAALGDGFRRFANTLKLAFFSDFAPVFAAGRAGDLSELRKRWPRRLSPPVQSLRDSATATPVGCPALRRRFRTFSFRLREMMSGMTSFFLTSSVPPRRLGG